MKQKCDNREFIPEGMINFHNCKIVKETNHSKTKKKYCRREICLTRKRNWCTIFWKPNKFFKYNNKSEEKYKQVWRAKAI